MRKRKEKKKKGNCFVIFTVAGQLRRGKEKVEKDKNALRKYLYSHKSVWGGLHYLADMKWMAQGNNHVTRPYKKTLEAVTIRE